MTRSVNYLKWVCFLVHCPYQRFTAYSFLLKKQLLTYSAWICYKSRFFHRKSSQTWFFNKNSPDKWVFSILKKYSYSVTAHTYFIKKKSPKVSRMNNFSIQQWMTCMVVFLHYSVYHFPLKQILSPNYTI